MPETNEQHGIVDNDCSPMKPRVRKGSWIDTGRYRPAQVLDMMPDPPHTMRLSYGDEIEDDFRPHIVEWNKIRKPRRLPSLTDEFSRGDWVQHAHYGYGHVVDLRNTTMTIKFETHESKLIPDRMLTWLVKVDGPPPVDDRPVAERFPPGTWIEHHYVGKALVLDVEGEILTVMSTRRFEQISASKTGNSSVIFRQAKAPLDLSCPIEQRRLWWWRYAYRQNKGWPCACCGYPIIGISSDDWEGLSHCIVCGWINTWATKQEVYPPTEEERFLPIMDSDGFLAQEWPNAGYTLLTARENFEHHGNMFDERDVRRDALKNFTEVRRQLVQKTDQIISRGSGLNDEDWTDIEQLNNLVEDWLASQPVEYS